MTERIDPERNPLPPGLQVYVDKLKVSAKQKVWRKHTLDPNSSSHPDKLEMMGQLWGGIREAYCRDVKQVAKQIGVEWQDLVLFEGGFLDPKDYKQGFIESLGEALNCPEVVQIHNSFFNDQSEDSENRST